MRSERWDRMRCCWSRCLSVWLHRHGSMTTRTDDFFWHVGKWLRSSAEIGRVGGRRMSRLDGTSLVCGGLFTCDGETATGKGRRWKDCLGA